jgi:diguanylate cyclase
MKTNSRTDDLTGVLTKAAILEQLETEIEKTRKKQWHLCVGYVDLDFFKKLNDEIGHQDGDEVIRQFASILQKNCRPKDAVGRMGAEHFLLMMPETEKEEALILVEDIRRLVGARPFKIKGGKKRATNEVQVTFSAGIAAVPQDGVDVTAVTRSADNALVMAKKSGRNRVILAVEEKMILKSNYYTRGSLDRLAEIARKNDVTEAFLLREALDDVIDKYDTRAIRKRG